MLLVLVVVPTTLLAVSIHQYTTPLCSAHNSLWNISTSYQANKLQAPQECLTFVGYCVYCRHVRRTAAGSLTLEKVCSFVLMGRVLIECNYYANSYVR